VTVLDAICHIESLIGVVSWWFGFVLLFFLIFYFILMFISKHGLAFMSGTCLTENMPSFSFRESRIRICWIHQLMKHRFRIGLSTSWKLRYVCPIHVYSTRVSSNHSRRRRRKNRINEGCDAAPESALRQQQGDPCVACEFTHCIFSISCVQSSR
jgi:hypothetical protein